MYWEDYGCVREYLGILTYSHSLCAGVARVCTVLYPILETVQYRHNCPRCTAPWAIYSGDATHVALPWAVPTRLVWCVCLYLPSRVYIRPWEAAFWQTS